MTRILIIDPESSGIDLVSELHKREVDVTTWWQDVPFVLRSGTDEGTPAADLVRFVDFNDFDLIVAGGESGVSAAEWLAARRGLPTSDPTLIHHRRDKNAMIDRLRSVGVAVGRSFLVTDPKQIDALMPQLDLPAMVKPSNSAGSDLCRAAATWDEARLFAREIIEGTSIMGNKNCGAVVQDFIEGPQYHVNTVVVDGVHEVTEVYSNLFRTVLGKPQLYAGRTFAQSEQGIQRVVDYALDTLRALGVTTGATHTEIRNTTSGPRLIEFNGRLMGPIQPSDYFIAAQGFSQASIWADVIAGMPGVARAALESRPEREFLGFYLLTATSSGTLVGFDETALVELPSFRGVFKRPQLGASLTIDNRTTDADLGIVLFAHREGAQLETDLAETEHLENSGRIHHVAITEKPSRNRPQTDVDENRR